MQKKLSETNNIVPIVMPFTKPVFLPLKQFLNINRAKLMEQQHYEYNKITDYTKHELAKHFCQINENNQI